MNKEEINILAGLLSELKEKIYLLESTIKNGENEKAIAIKREIIGLQNQISRKL